MWQELAGDEIPTEVVEVEQVARLAGHEAFFDAEEGGGAGRAVSQCTYIYM